MDSTLWRRLKSNSGRPTAYYDDNESYIKINNYVASFSMNNIKT